MSENSETIELYCYVCNIFEEWKPYKKYNLGECKGYFFELLIYKLLKNIYSEDNLYLETKIKTDNYLSHTWDIILETVNKYYCYECKFSSTFLKRKHINQMLSLINKLDNSKSYLVVYSRYPHILDKLYELRADTSVENYENMLNQINLVTLDDFCRGNPFVYEEMINNT